MEPTENRNKTFALSTMIKIALLLFLFAYVALPDLVPSRFGGLAVLAVLVLVTFMARDLLIAKRRFTRGSEREK